MKHTQMSHQVAELEWWHLKERKTGASVVGFDYGGLNGGLGV